MATTTEKTMGGIVGLVLLLAGFGGSQLLTPEQLDRAYVCPLTEELGFFDKLSGSGKTGYYTVDGLEESESCRSGYDFASWVKLSEYAKQEGISVEEFLRSQESSGSSEIAEKVKVNANNRNWDCEVKDGEINSYTKCYSKGREGYLGEFI